MCCWGELKILRAHSVGEVSAILVMRAIFRIKNVETEVSQAYS